VIQHWSKTLKIKLTLFLRVFQLKTVQTGFSASPFVCKQEISIASKITEVVIPLTFAKVRGAKTKILSWQKKNEFFFNVRFLFLLCLGD
jgi:hypothetical protein